VAVLLIIAAMIGLVAFIVFVERSERRIPVQSARRIVGRRQMGGVSSHLPLKVNSGGVMPVIFASSILSAPLLFGQMAFVQSNKVLSESSPTCSPVNPGTSLLYVGAIIFFAYFYISIVFRPDDMPTTCVRAVASSPAFAPVGRTSDYINGILTRITLVGLST